MAIQVNGTTVIDNSRALTNISSVDATTVAALGAAGVGGGSVSVVAEGNIANGDRVVLLSNGKAQTISGVSQAINGDNNIESYSSNTYTLAAYDPSTEKLLVMWKEGSSSAYTKAAVGTISGTSISFGTAVTTSSTEANYPKNCLISIGGGKFIYGWAGGSTILPQLRVISISGTTVSLGSVVNLVSHASGAYLGDISWDSVNSRGLYSINNYSPYATQFGTFTVSGTSISATSPVSHPSYNNYHSAYPQHDFDPVAGKHVVAFKPSSTNYVALVDTSTSTPSWGTEISTVSDSMSGTVVRYLPSPANKTMVAYITTSSFRSFFVSVSGSTPSISPNPNVPSISNVYSLSYDATYNRVFANISYNNVPSILTIDVGSSSFTNSTVSLTVSTGSSYGVWDPSNEILFTLKNTGLSPYQTNWAIFRPAAGNLLLNSFIGISDGAYSSGQTATIQTSGTDDAQTGLTAGQTYYVNSGNELVTEEIVDNVTNSKVGVALSSTSILIQP